MSDPTTPPTGDETTLDAVLDLIREYGHAAEAFGSHAAHPVVGHAGAQSSLNAMLEARQELEDAVRAALASGETRHPDSVREEWVVQNGLHDEPGVWEDYGAAWEYEASGRNMLALHRQYEGHVYRFRLVHRVITEEVVE